MINLIPNDVKKKKMRDFYLRLVTTCFFVLAVTVLVASASMLPAYFLSNVKINFINNKLETQKEEVVPDFDKQNLAEVGDLNKKLALIEKSEADKYLVSQKIVDEILKNKMPDIKITKISYQADKARGGTVGIGGTAPSRDRLLLFKKALDDDTNFTKVDLPISNFVKGSDIQFNLTLVPA